MKECYTTLLNIICDTKDAGQKRGQINDHLRPDKPQTTIIPQTRLVRCQFRHMSSADERQNVVYMG